MVMLKWVFKFMMVLVVIVEAMIVLMVIFLFMTIIYWSRLVVMLKRVC